MKKLSVIIVFCLAPLFLWAQEIPVKLDGQKLKTISIDEIKKMKELNVEFFNGVTRRSELYKGVSTLGLIEKIYPESQNLLEIELITENNFTSFISINRLQQTSSILAYDRADGDKFVRFSQKEKVLVSLAPLYLVWDLKGVSKEDRLLHSSIYQIKAINLVTNKIDFGVKEDAVDSSVYLGYQAYKSQCMTCHALGKIGGTYSFDLIKRKTRLSKGDDYLRKYITDARTVNPKTKMLPFPKFKNSEEMIQGVIDFLKFMENPEELLDKKKAAASQNSYKELREIVQGIR
jgi:hypothetical protein